MSKDGIIMGLGVLVAIEPFLGFPNAWDTYVLMGLGMGVIAMGIVVRRTKESRARSTPPPYES